MSLKSQRLGTPSLKSLPEGLCSGFLHPEKKNPSASAGFEPLPWISRRVRYPETDFMKYKYILNIISLNNNF